MNIQDFNQLTQDTIKSTASLLISKGEEYAGSADRLANFKRGSKLTGVTPLQVALVYASKHYDSIATFVRKDASGEQQSLSEPIEGRFDDMINYMILMKALVVEAARNPEPISTADVKIERISNPKTKHHVPYN